MALPDEPITRSEKYLSAIAGEETTLPDYPITRSEQYLAKIATGEGETPAYPITREEQYFDYIAENGGGGGDITVQPLTVTENGTYNPGSGKAYKPVTVNVPQEEPVIEPLSVAENGTYTAPDGTDGYSPVVVNVPQTEPVLDTLSVTENGTYTPETGTDGFDEVVVNVQGGAATQEQLDSIATGIGVATPSTPASIESAVDGLIEDANEATGESDDNLTDAVSNLIDGYVGSTQFAAGKEF